VIVFKIAIQLLSAVVLVHSTGVLSTVLLTESSGQHLFLTDLLRLGRDLLFEAAIV
jgi:hypothetical protein